MAAVLPPSLPDGAVAFADVQRVLALFAQGLLGRTLHLRPFDPQPGADGKVRQIGTDGESIHLPASVHDFETPAHNLGAYRIVILHQIGYLQQGTFDFDLRRAATRLAMPSLLQAAIAGPKRVIGWAPVPMMSQLEQFFAAWSRPQLLRRIFSTLEALRIDHANRQLYPGARADLDRVLALALARRPGLAGLRPVARLLEALVHYSLNAERSSLERQFTGNVAGDAPIVDPYLAQILDSADRVRRGRATVYDSAGAALAIGELIDQLLSRPQLTRSSTPRASELDELEPPEKGPPADASLGQSTDDIDGDTEQSPDPIDGPGVEFRGELLPDMVYRKFKAGKVGSLPSDTSTTVTPSDEPLTDDMDDDDLAEDDENALPLRPVRVAGMRRTTIDGPQSFLYDEWNYLSQDYHKAWCRVFEHRLRGDDHAFISDVRRRHAMLASQVKRQFGFIKPESWHRVHRTSDGDELELDGLIEAVIDRRAGQATDEHLYVRRDRGLREVAAAFLVDMSASTDFPIPDRIDPDAPPKSANKTEYGPYLYGGYDDLAEMTPALPKRRVIDVAKESMVLMADALQTLGDSHAIYGFSSDTRENVEFHVAKDFGDPLSARTWAALAAMQPRRSTRMGPAIRHAAVKLSRQPVRRKVLIIVSDGYPEDSDYGPDRGDEEYGVQDTARALQEAERAGITTFCITIDPAGHDYLRRMCTEHRYLVIDDVMALPDELTKVYRALTVR